MYYLQSRYFDPAISRFVNADSYASTGQGIIGNNMFMYCNNNPITYFDASGNLPQAVTDKIVHDAVLRIIVSEQPNLSMTQTCIYYNGESIWGGFGYCDLYSTTTGEVWELKKDSQSRSCRTSSALTQLSRYTTGKLKYHPNLQLRIADQTQIAGGSFVFTQAGYTYNVSYWSENNGVLRYSYKRYETDGRKAAEAVATILAIGFLMYTAPYSLPGVGVVSMLS